ncbi:MAG: DUF3828 domain-containing protein [Saprospiraceae bacterium]|nr:DUF3828 domain-containing protein [Saprospiraceae bacterium]
MKNLILLFALSAFGFVACNNKPAATETAATTEAPTNNGGSPTEADLVEITNTIHNFYAWYDANIQALSNIHFLKGSGNSTTIDEVKLNDYHNALKNSGSLSQAYLDSDKAYLKNLEATAWKNENVEETPLSGYDYDLFFCAQDWDIAFWKTAAVTTEALGTDKVTATMSGQESGGPRTQKFELVKENGKWLISKIICAQ